MRHSSRALAACLLALAACSGGGSPPASSNAAAAAPATQAPPEDLSKIDTAIAPSLKVNLKAMRQTASGLYLLDQREGTGAPIEKGKTARVHYTGWLTDGKEFDSSRNATPIEFAVGEGRVIKGWDEGLVGMRVGGRRMLVIPPELGYGRAGQPGIPGRATLIFQIDLLGIR